jgi:hypothetical protein
MISTKLNLSRDRVIGPTSPLASPVWSGALVEGPGPARGRCTRGARGRARKARRGHSVEGGLAVAHPPHPILSHSSGARPWDRASYAIPSHLTNLSATVDLPDRAVRLVILGYLVWWCPHLDPRLPFQGRAPNVSEGWEAVILSPPLVDRGVSETCHWVGLPRACRDRGDRRSLTPLPRTQSDLSEGRGDRGFLVANFCHGINSGIGSPMIWGDYDSTDTISRHDVVVSGNQQIGCPDCAVTDDPD